jgi:hypothetical protein
VRGREPAPACAAFLHCRAHETACAAQLDDFGVDAVEGAFESPPFAVAGGGAGVVSMKERLDDRGFAVATDESGTVMRLGRTSADT